MYQPSLKQWDEDRKRLRVIYDHSRAKPVERKNKIKKSRQAAFRSVLAERTKPSIQHQDTKSNTSDSSLGKVQSGAHAKRDEASSQRQKGSHHMIQIFIKTPNISPKNLCLRLNHNTTVSDLKNIIHSKLGIRPALQNLYTNNQGFKLCDDLTLLDLGIKPETNIDLTLAKGLLGGAPKLDKAVLLRTLARKLGTDWQQLAVKLRLGPADISQFESLVGSNPEEQAFQMLDSWWRKQADHDTDDTWAGEWLKAALILIGRRDLAAMIPGYAPTTIGASHTDEVHIRKQSAEHQDSPINEKMLRVLAENIGKDWRQLATYLGVTAAQIDTYQIDYQSDLKEQAFQMLLGWLRRQPDQKDAENVLIEKLKEVGRFDMVQMVTGVTGLPFKAMSETLVSHYKETLKVNTYPTCKDLAADMEQLYVSLELLRETNLPGQPLILESGSKKGNNKTDRTMTLDISEHGVDENQKEYKKIPLDSYEDMLSSDKKRILITAESGYGKSTLLKKIAYDWAVLQGGTHSTPQKKKSPLSMFKLVILLEINKMGGKFNIVNETFSQILPETEFEKKHLQNFITQHPDKVLFLLDGADEVSFETLQKAEEDFSVNNVLSFKSLKRCKVIVTSRQSTALKLLKRNPDFTRVNIVGFDDKNKKEYIRRYFSSYNSEHHDHVYSEINKSETLRSLGEIPLFLWLMCSSLTQPGSQLPDRISELLRLATSLMYEQKISKDCTSKPQQKITEEGFNLLMTKLGRVALGGLTSRGKYSFAVSEFDSEDDVNLGCDVGLLTRVQIMHGMKKVEQVKFYHTILMQFCCSVYLSGITESNTGKFNEHMSTLLEGDVERFGHLFRFCSGMNTKAAQCVVEMTKKHLSVYNKNSPVDCERYVCLHKVMMLALFEANLGVTVKTLELDEWVRFPYKLKGEDLLAAHYFVQNLQQRSSLQHLSHLTIICQGQTDLDLLEQTMAGIVMCDLTLEVVGVNMSDKIHKLKNISKCVISLSLKKCQLSCVSVPGLFKLLKSATKLKILELSGNNLHGLKSVQMPNNLSLRYLILNDCKLTQDDIGPLFSIVAAAGSVTKLRIHENDLHGIKAEEITPVSSLDELHLITCGIQIDDIGPLFSIVAAAGSVTNLVLCRNDLHGIKADEVTLVSSLKELHLYECGIQGGDIGPLFSILAATGSVTKLVLIGNNLHGIKGDAITRISLLKELHLYESGIQIDDIGPLFSIIAAAGDIRRLVLYRNDLHGIQADGITRVSSLKELHLNSCGIQGGDIGSVFFVLAATGCVSTLVLVKNDLHGIKGDEITPVSSLDELRLCECGIQSDDIGPLFSIVAAARNVTKLDLIANDLHGLKGDKITPVSSLKELHLFACSIQSGDIGPLFSIVASAGSVTRLVLAKNDLHGITADLITPVSSLIELHVEACGLQSDDIGPLFSIVAAAGSVSTLAFSTDNLHGIKGDEIAHIFSLNELHIIACSIQSDDIGPLFSIVAAAGSVTKLVLNKTDIHGIKADKITPVSSLIELHLEACGIQSDDIGPLFSIVAAAGSVSTLVLDKNNLRGITGDEITPVSSLNELHLYACGIQSDDIGPVFSIVAAAGSVTRLVLRNNYLHGIQGDQITKVSSLKDLYLVACGLQRDDIGPLFSIVAAAGSVSKLVLRKNDLHGIQGDQITQVSSLEDLYLEACGIQSDDIGPLFSTVAAAGSVSTLVLDNNNLRGITGDEITPVSSLNELHLNACGIQSGDIGPLFSIVATAGSVTRLVLNDNNLHGIKGDQITPVSSLIELHLEACGIQSDDIGPLFSTVAAAGSVSTLVLDNNNLRGITGDEITPVSSLNELHLYACGIQSDDIGPVFSIVAAAGSVTRLVLRNNYLHGIQGDQITKVSSLKDLYLVACGIQRDDIGTLFSIVAAAGSVSKLALVENDLRGLKRDDITPVSSLNELHLYTCGVQSADIRPLFSIVATAGSIKKVYLLTPGSSLEVFSL
ncbi:uncharacterized protein LOC117289125 [Asterias rubens]|uniref:uncharacterized protein LOC117289125 n=1 Tax=Asterias rubens TaxID=7604 RepID=UPI0014554F47|nr:uncharacterized protein LOC117289125 [Asterias rubens]